MPTTKSTASPTFRAIRTITIVRASLIASPKREFRDIHPLRSELSSILGCTMKSLTPRFLTSLVSTSGSLVLAALLFPACGTGTDDLFQTSGGDSSAGGEGGKITGAGGNGGDGGASSGGQGGQGGTGTNENCLDGLDNDMDGATDCADSDCTEGFTCADEPPEGWTSVTLDQGPGTPPTPMPCSNGAMPESLFTGPAGPPECSTCECGNLTGNTCTNAGLFCFPGSGNCAAADQEDWTNSFATGNCAKPDIGVTFSLSCRLANTTMVDQEGSCPPSTSDFTNKDTWMGWVQACAIPTNSGGCTKNSVCTPKPTGTQSLCIRHDGQENCPGGWTAVEAFASATDDRSCGACSCTAKATCTSGDYQVFDSNNCDPNNGNPITIDSMCRNVSSNIDFGSWSVQKNPAVPGGSCTPQGGDPAGSVQTQGPVTFCCK